MSGIILVLVLYVKYRPNRQELIVEGKNGRGKSWTGARAKKTWLEFP